MINKSLLSKIGLFSKNIATFSTTIAIFSGSLHNDIVTDKIIKGIKKTFKQPVKFIGIGGPSIKEDFVRLYDCSSKFDNTPIQVHKYYTEVYVENPIMPYRIITHFKNKKVLDSIKDQNIFNDLVSQRVSAIINVGNFSFTKRLNTQIRQYYDLQSKVAPPTFLYDKFHFHRAVEHESFLDHQFYYLPRKPDNWAYYEFPSTCIGYDGAYNAFRYLAKFRSDQGLDFATDLFGQKIHELTRSARKDYRNKLRINEDNFAIVLAPGNQDHEIKMSFSHFTESLKIFFNNPRIKQINPQNFNFFVLNPTSQPKASKLIQTQFKQLKTQYKNAILVGESDKYAALASADFGIIHNGQITVQAAACQLPAVVIDSMSVPHAYISYLMNVFESPLNIATIKQGYQQLLSSSAANPEKLADITLRHFQNPKLKFYYISIYEKAFQNMLKKSGLNPNMNVSETGFETSYKKIESSVLKYQEIDINNYSTHWTSRKQIISP